MSDLVDPDNWPIRSSGDDKREWNEYKNDSLEDAIPVILGVATRFTQFGDTVEKHTKTIATHWLGLGECYVAPEQEKVLGLLKPAERKADIVSDDCTDIASALNSYAEDLAAVLQRLVILETEAREFVDWLRAQDPPMHVDPEWTDSLNNWRLGFDWDRKVYWDKHGPTVEKNNEFMSRLDELKEEIRTAAQTCADAIWRAVPRDMLAELPKGPDIVGPPYDPNEPNYWGGNYTKEDKTCLEQMFSSGGDFLTSVGTLLGRDPETGEVSWETAGKSWGALLDLLGSIVMYPVAVVSEIVYNSLNATVFSEPSERNPVQQWLYERFDRVNTVAAGLVSIDIHHSDPFHLWKEEPYYAMTSLATNAVMFLIPTAAVGTSLRVGSAGARVLRAGGVVADMGIPFASFGLRALEAVGQGARVLARTGEVSEALNIVRMVSSGSGRVLRNAAVQSTPESLGQYGALPRNNVGDGSTVTARSGGTQLDLSIAGHNAASSASVYPGQSGSSARTGAGGAHTQARSAASAASSAPASWPGVIPDSLANHSGEVSNLWTRADKVISETLQGLDRWNANDRAIFESYFGSATESNRLAVRQTFERMGQEVRDAELFDANPALISQYPEVFSSPERVNAFVSRNQPSERPLEIFTTPDFWRKLADDRVQVIVHELSHGKNVPSDGGGQVVDYLYGRHNVQELAKARPDLAMQNADSIAYYAQEYMLVNRSGAESASWMTEAARNDLSVVGHSTVTSATAHPGQASTPVRDHAGTSEVRWWESPSVREQIGAPVHTTASGEKMVHVREHTGPPVADRPGSQAQNQAGAPVSGHHTTSGDVARVSGAVPRGQHPGTSAPSGRGQFYDLSQDRPSVSRQAQSHGLDEGIVGPVLHADSQPALTGRDGSRQPQASATAPGRASDSSGPGGEQTMDGQMNSQAPREPSVADREQAFGQAPRDGGWPLDYLTREPLDSSGPAWDRRLPEHERFQHDLVWDQAAGEFRAVRPVAGGPTPGVLVEFPRPATLGDAVKVRAPLDPARGVAPPAVTIDGSGRQVLHDGTRLEADTRYDIAGRGRFYTAADGKVVRVELTSEAGRKLHPDAQRGRLLPDVEYVQGNVVYRTNSEGIVYLTDVRGQAVTRGTRVDSVQATVGAEGRVGSNYPGERYQGGHKIGTQTGGSPDGINLTPMLEEINNARSGFKHSSRVEGPSGPDGRRIQNFGDVEESLVAYQRENPRSVVDRQLEEVYDYAVSKRVPVEIVSRYRIDGGPWVENRFDNVPEYDPGTRPQKSDGNYMNDAEYAAWKRQQVEESGRYQVTPEESARLASAQREALRQALREAVEAVGAR